MSDRMGVMCPDCKVCLLADWSEQCPNCAVQARWSADATNRGEWVVEPGGVRRFVVRPMPPKIGRPAEPIPTHWTEYQMRAAHARRAAGATDELTLIGDRYYHRFRKRLARQAHKAMAS